MHFIEYWKHRKGKRRRKIVGDVQAGLWKAKVSRDCPSALWTSHRPLNYSSEVWDWTRWRLWHRCQIRHLVQKPPANQSDTLALFALCRIRLEVKPSLQILILIALWIAKLSLGTSFIYLFIYFYCTNFGKGFERDRGPDWSADRNRMWICEIRVVSKGLETVPCV